MKRATGEETFAQDLYLNPRKEREREREKPLYVKVCTFIH